MKSLEETLEITGSCYYNILRSVVELLPIEGSGDIVGKRNLTTHIAINSYPIQTATRKPSSVEYGDEKALKRVRDFNKAVNYKGGLGTYLLGGYHSHVRHKREKINNGLSKTDLNYIEGELTDLKMNYWIEIVLNVKKRKPQKNKKPAYSLVEYPRKLKAIISLNPKEKYEIHFSAYKVTRRAGKIRVKELKIKQRKVKIKPL